MGGAEAAGWRNETLIAEQKQQTDRVNVERDVRPLESMMNRVSCAVSNLDAALCAFEERVGPVMACSVATDRANKGEIHKGQSILFEQLASLALRIEDLGERIREDIRRVEL